MGLHEANRIARAAERVRRHGRMSLKVALPTAAALGAGAAIAVGSIPGSNGTITACYQTVDAGTAGADQLYGAVRIIDPSNTTDVDTHAYQCDPSTEATITWNQQGPPGQPGANGSNGASGAPGAKGATGAATINGDTGLTVEGGGGTNIAATFSTGIAKPDLDKAGQLPLDSFSVGMNQVVASSGAASKASFPAFTFVTDNTGKLFSDLVADETRGLSIGEVDVTVGHATKGKSTTVETFKLRNVVIKHITQSGKKLDVGGVFSAETIVVGSGDNKVPTKLGTVTTTGWDLTKVGGA
jgi:hypothetical protein